MDSEFGTDMASLLRSMLEVQAESLRLQRLLVERLLGAPSPPRPVAPPSAVPQLEARASDAAPPGPPRAQDEVQSAAPKPLPTEPPQAEPVQAEPLQAEPPQAEPVLAEPRAVLRGDDMRSRGARYYQPRPAPAAHGVKPEDLELLRRLQQLREASNLILQFGPFRGTTLAQVAMGHPEYIRDLVFSARRPEVRVAAGQLVEALDAAAEHKRKPARASSRLAYQ